MDFVVIHRGSTVCLNRGMTTKGAFLLVSWAIMHEFGSDGEGLGWVNTVAISPPIANMSGYKVSEAYGKTPRAHGLREC
jgi:hypothetical protein